MTAMTSDADAFRWIPMGVLSQAEQRNSAAAGLLSLPQSIETAARVHPSFRGRPHRNAAELTGCDTPWMQRQRDTTERHRYCCLCLKTRTCVLARTRRHDRRQRLLRIPISARWGSLIVGLFVAVGPLSMSPSTPPWRRSWAAPVDARSRPTHAARASADEFVDGQIRRAAPSPHVMGLGSIGDCRLSRVTPAGRC